MGSLGNRYSSYYLGSHSRNEREMNKIQDITSRLGYGTVIGSFALVGLISLAKEKVLDKIKKI